jgi:hypothetical protein
MNSQNISDIAGILDGLRGYFYPHEWGEWDHIGGVSVSATGINELYSASDVKIYLYGFVISCDNTGAGGQANITISFDPDAGTAYRLEKRYVPDGEFDNCNVWYPMPWIISADGDIDVEVQGAITVLTVDAYGYIET